MSIVVGLIKIVGDTLRDRYSIITLNDRSLTRLIKVFNVKSSFLCAAMNCLCDLYKKLKIQIVINPIRRPRFNFDQRSRNVASVIPQRTNLITVV